MLAIVSSNFVIDLRCQHRYRCGNIDNPYFRLSFFDILERIFHFNPRGQLEPVVLCRSFVSYGC